MNRSYKFYQVTSEKLSDQRGESNLAKIDSMRPAIVEAWQLFIESLVGNRPSKHNKDGVSKQKNSIRVRHETREGKVCLHCSVYIGFRIFHWICFEWKE